MDEIFKSIKKSNSLLVSRAQHWVTITLYIDFMEEGCFPVSHWWHGPQIPTVYHTRNEWRDVAPSLNRNIIF